MKRREQRLRLLEARGAVGCATCRFWGPCVSEVGDRGPERGESCPDCGRVVEIRLLRRIILIPPEAR